ncbi:effector-associated constant component EACC1 [Microbispora sp. H10830]|uniref:effector-associated constant component EACC1 n=1 Tax=Microbispora sp. H10830 TaxID=2729109 RepID=UPI0016020B23|nr:hypothetical protein [Microbispora sp. H10830]
MEDNAPLLIQSGNPDQLRELYAWLAEEPDLRGRVQVAEQEPAPGTMGAPVAALEIVLAGGKAIVAVASAVVAWLHTRSGEVSIRLNRGGQEIEVSAKGVKNLDSDGVVDLTRRVAANLEAPHGG